MIKMKLAHIEWDCCLPIGMEATKDALRPWRETTPAGRAIAISHPLKVGTDDIVPVAQYNVFTSRRRGTIGITQIEDISPDSAISKIGRVIYTTHLGNQDDLLYNKMYTATCGVWRAPIELTRFILHDMLIYLPVDPYAVLREVTLNTEKHQEQEDVPALGVVVTPPTQSTHESIHAYDKALRAASFLNNMEKHSVANYSVAT